MAHTTLDDVLKLFRGKSAEQIASTMARSGIKGRSGTTYSCPMAVLLNTTHTGQFIVGRKYIVRRSGGTIEKRRTPANLRALIQGVDRGTWPALMAVPPRCQPKRTKRRGGERTKRGPRGTIKNHLAKLVARFDD